MFNFLVHLILGETKKKNLRLVCTGIWTPDLSNKTTAVAADGFIFKVNPYIRLVHNSVGSDFVSRLRIPVAMGLFLGCHFLFQVKNYCCAWVYTLNFCHLKIVSRTVDARKWSAKWRSWNISDIIIVLFEFNREAKAAEAARNICAVYCDNAIGESTAIKWFSRFKEDLLTLVTPHVQEDLRGLMKNV